MAHLVLHRLLLLAMCLILFPRLLLFISETTSATERRTALTPLESFLALHFGIWLAATSLALALNVRLFNLCLTFSLSGLISPTPIVFTMPSIKLRFLLLLHRHLCHSRTQLQAILY
jgi:hypothetical protein